MEGSVDKTNTPDDLRKLARVVKGRAEGRLLERADVLDFLIEAARDQDPSITAMLLLCAKAIAEGKHAK